jgi:uncharacterized damage-inducible protein DinB
MRSPDVRMLLDYTAWANRQVLATARDAGPEVFTAPVTVTYRNLRATLVHTLDVERSWRDRVRGLPPEVWDDELVESDFPTVDDLAARWATEDAELDAWLTTVDDEAMGAVVDLGGRDVFPLWYFLVHVVTHSAEQRRDAALLLRMAGHPPPDLEFLYYADSLEAAAGSSGEPG